MKSILKTHVETQIGHTIKESQKNDEFYDKDIFAWMEKNKRNYPTLKKKDEQNIFRSFNNELADLWAVISKLPVTTRIVEMIKKESAKNEEGLEENERIFRIIEVILEIIGDFMDAHENGDKNIHQTIKIETGRKIEDFLPAWKEIVSSFLRIKNIEEELLLRNMGLVAKISRKFTGRGIPFSDLFQEGVLGLMKSLWRFDIEKGFKFSTYATWWITQSVMRSIADKAETMRRPVHMHELMAKIDKATRKLSQELGRFPTNKEVAEKIRVPLEKVREVKNIPSEPVSMSDPFGKDEKSTLGDFIVDTRTDDHVENINQAALQEAVRLILRDLPKKEREVIERRFGLTGGAPQTLEEVGAYFKVTRERIRQIENKAMQKIKHPSRLAIIKEFSGNRKPKPKKDKKVEPSQIKSRTKKQRQGQN